MNKFAAAALAAMSFAVLSSTAAEAYRLSGSATYYGPGFCGNKTASGDVFRCNQLTAAHRTLPFGTVLRVENAAGRSVEVVVNDRGPFTGAFLDLSPAAADQMGGRHTHHRLTATIVKMGDGGTRYARARAPAAQQPAFQNPFAALFGGSEDVMRPVGFFGQTMAQAPVRVARHHKHKSKHRRHH